MFIWQCEVCGRSRWPWTLRWPPVVIPLPGSRSKLSRSSRPISRIIGTIFPRSTSTRANSAFAEGLKARGDKPMSYRLNHHETISDGIMRIAVEQIDKALARLQSTRGNQDDAIHDGRVCLKKIRAALRLVQTAMEPDIFRQE